MTEKCLNVVTFVKQRESIADDGLQGSCIPDVRSQCAFSNSMECELILLRLTQSIQTSFTSVSKVNLSEADICTEYNHVTSNEHLNVGRLNVNVGTSFDNLKEINAVCYIAMVAFSSIPFQFYSLIILQFDSYV